MRSSKQKASPAAAAPVVGPVLFAPLAAPASAALATIPPGRRWRDASGKRVQPHGHGLVALDGRSS
jgi:hypothetical protein